jgi:hypothetical protein
MKTIRDLTGAKRTTGDYGVEIEVEGKRLPRTLGEVWRVEKDNSLKTAEAWEYVMPKPLDLIGVKKALDYLSMSYVAHNSEVDESIRAGVHVHVNVQEWNIKQLMTFATTYYILEDVLMNWCGPDREGNLFCLRAKDAEYILFQLYKTLNSRNLKHLNNDVIRYASLNFLSLFSYGSVEFRGMRGTGNLDIIYDWVRIIDDMKQSSFKYDSPNDLMAAMSGDGGLTFFETILPNTHHLFEKKGIEESVRSAARRVQMIAFGIDWTSLSTPSINIFSQESFA